VYGQMSASNEITAVKAAGVPPLTLVRPILTLAFLLSLVVVWLNDVAVSWGRLGMNRVVLESVEQVVYSMLRSDKACTMRRFSINVRGVEGQKLLQPSITLRLDDHGPPMVCMAEEAELRCDPAAETLKILMRDCEITWGKYRGNFPDTVAQVIPLADATRRGNESARPSDTILGRIPGELKRQTEEIEQLKRDFAIEGAIQMMTGDLHGLTSPEWDARHGQIQSHVTRLHRLQTEPWRRFANGFSCFFFVLVGAPVAIRLRKAFVWSSFLISLLTILLPYYLLMVYSTGEAKSGDLPPYVVWLGNAAMALAGIYQVRKMQRY
jgi:lipopolysaccharide export system permease protein